MEMTMQMQDMPISMVMDLSAVGLYAAILGLIFVILSIRVTQGRTSKKIDLGDGGDADMSRRIRVHGNFIEYVPIAILLIGFAEASGAARWLVHVLGISLVVARLAHIHGLSTSTLPTRVFGTTVTWLVLAVASILVLLPFLGVYLR